MLNVSIIRQATTPVDSIKSIVASEEGVSVVRKHKRH